MLSSLHHPSPSLPPLGPPEPTPGWAPGQQGVGGSGGAVYSELWFILLLSLLGLLLLALLLGLLLHRALRKSPLVRERPPLVPLQKRSQRDRDPFMVSGRAGGRAPVGEERMMKKRERGRQTLRESMALIRHLYWMWYSIQHQIGMNISNFGYSYLLFIYLRYLFIIY